MSIFSSFSSPLGFPTTSYFGVLDFSEALFFRLNNFCLFVFRFIHFSAFLNQLLNPYSEFFLRLYLFLDRGEGREAERERNIKVWLPLMCPLLGTRPATQACALTGNRTRHPLVCRRALNPLSHTSQGYSEFLTSVTVFSALKFSFDSFLYNFYLKNLSLLIPCQTFL